MPRKRQSPLPPRLQRRPSLPRAPRRKSAHPTAQGGPYAGEPIDEGAILQPTLTDEEGPFDDLPAADDGGVEDGVIADEEPHRDASNFLAVYFREMAQLAVLRPEQEFEIARRIGALEIELWVRLLLFAPMTERVLHVLAQVMGATAPDLEPLVLRAREAKAAADPEALLREGVIRLAERLRRQDLDRRLVGAVLCEIKAIARTGRGQLTDGPVAIDLTGRPFRRYLHGISVMVRRVQQAKNDFVKANLRLVVSIARRFNHGRMPLADLIQEGNIGLIKAVERFDYRRGYRFSTYASWWIRHAISRGLADKGRAVRLPVHMIDVHHRLSRSKRELSGKLGRPPTTEELSAATGMAQGKIDKMRGYLLDQSLSLDRAVSEHDGRRFIDFMQDESPRAQPGDLLTSVSMNHELRRVLCDLKPIEADILRQRFGLDTDKELTLKEIGEKYNLSRERIRQLQEQALGKMRRALCRGDMA